MIGTLDSKIPPGPLAQKWRSHRDHSRLVSPNNRRKLEIIVVGRGHCISSRQPEQQRDHSRSAASPHLMVAYRDEPLGVVEGSMARRDVHVERS